MAPTIYPALRQPTILKSSPPAGPLKLHDPSMPFQDQPIRFQRPSELPRFRRLIVVPPSRR